MMRLVVLFLIGLSSLLQCGAFFQSIGRAMADFPNPNIDPLACGRLNVPRSSICDPDKLLTNDDKNLIEGYISKISQAQVAVAVMDKMSMKGLSTTDIDTASERFARGLHDKWGVGSTEKQDGILMLFSISDRAVYISTGSGVQGIMTHSTIQALISNMKPMLRKKKYGTAIADCLIQIDLLLSGKGSSGIFSAFGNKTISAPAEETFWEFGVAFGAFLSVVGLAVFCKINDDRRMRNYQRGRDMINNLMTAVDPADPPPQDPQSPHLSLPSQPIATATQPKPQYLSTSCPICLEDFPKKEESRHKKDEDAVTSTPSADPQRAPMALQCGHVFCKGCLETFLSSVEGNNCPICRAPVDPSLGAGGGNRGSADGRSRSGWNPFSPRVRTLDAGRLRQDYESYWTSRASSGGGTFTQTYSRAETMLNDPSPQFDSFSQHSPEIRFRLHRMRSLYPDIMSLELLRSMNMAMDRGSVYDVRNQLDLRSRELNRMVENMRRASEASARNTGMRGSSYSFGGGRSSGGGGGRW